MLWGWGKFAFFFHTNTCGAITDQKVQVPEGWLLEGEGVQPLLRVDKLQPSVRLTCSSHFSND